MQKHITNSKSKSELQKKKEWYLEDVELNQKGNPLLNPNYGKPLNFPKPTKQDLENKKYQDVYGNPLPGYKWKRIKTKKGFINKIVVDKKYKDKIITGIKPRKITLATKEQMQKLKKDLGL